MSIAGQRTHHLRALAGDQCGLLTRDQLRLLGFDGDAVASHVAGGRWTRLGPRVVALQTGPLTEAQIQWYAVLDGGTDCVLSGLSALRCHGLEWLGSECVQTAVPLDGKASHNSQFIRRRSRRLVTTAVHPARRPPAMRAEVALVDALEHLRDRRLGCALLAAIVQQRILRATTIRPLIENERTLPHRRLYRCVAGDIEGGAHSLLEIDFGALTRRAGIPAPRRQSVRVDSRGRRRYLDADFDGFLVEVDGALHLRPLRWWDDLHRMNEITLRGTPTLRFPTIAIRLHQEVVIDQLRRAAERWL